GGAGRDYGVRPSTGTVIGRVQPTSTPPASPAHNATWAGWRRSSQSPALRESARTHRRQVTREAATGARAGLDAPEVIQLSPPPRLPLPAAIYTWSPSVAAWVPW